MLYLYAIAERDGLAVPELHGLEDAEVSALPAGGMVAVVSRHEGLTLEPTQDAVARHAEIVERLMDAGATLLPARFGRAFRDETRLAAAVARQAAALEEALEVVRGCVELGVRVVRRDSPAPEPPRAPSSGRDYMQSLLERQARHAETAAAIHEPLARLSVRSEHRPLGTPTLLVSSAYLVPREGVEEFTSAVERLQQAHDELALVLTGPWPPYSFVPETA